MTTPTDPTPTNAAAWLPAKGAPLQVGPAPYTPPGPGEVVVRARAVAVDPVDWIVQRGGGLVFRWVTPPFILGSDVAGDVVEVGPGVSRLAVGDRVLAHAVETDPQRDRAAEGAFQTFVVVLERLTSPIPGAMAYEDAAALPLGLSTAACGLFQAKHLGLRHPTAGAAPTGESVLVWGGSTSVGSNAVQLAIAAGYDVVSTAGPHNADLVRRLGARAVVDHGSPTAVDDAVDALRGRRVVGAMAIGDGSPEACSAVMAASGGRRRVAMATGPVTMDGFTPSPAAVLRLGAGMVTSGGALVARNLRRRVRSSFVFGSSLDADEVGPEVYERFLPGALADGRYVAAPPPLVVGLGPERVQEAREVVVTL